MQMVECLDMDASVRAVEEILKYSFTNKKLLEEALIHSSCNDCSANYQRLEHLGDAALRLAITKYMFTTYPEVNQHQLTLLRKANDSNEKLARVAVRRGLYRYVRRNSADLDGQVKDFTMMVEQEDELDELYGGKMKAPKVLADIVESVAAALYVDCGFDLDRLWEIFRDFLKPIVTLDLLQQQPISMLYVLCEKEGKQLDIETPREGEETIASVYIDGEFIVSCANKNKKIATLQAAKDALQNLPFEINDKMNIDLYLDENIEKKGVKQTLNELCVKKGWDLPSYGTAKEFGPDHDKRFICYVEVATTDGVLFRSGDEKSQLKDAERSAASKLLRHLQEYNLI